MKIKYKEEILKMADEKIYDLQLILRVDFSTENMKSMKQQSIFKIEITANL